MQIAEGAVVLIDVKCVTKSVVMRYCSAAEISGTINLVLQMLENMFVW